MVTVTGRGLHPIYSDLNCNLKSQKGVVKGSLAMAQHATPKFFRGALFKTGAMIYPKTNGELLGIDPFQLVY